MEEGFRDQGGAVGAPPVLDRAAQRAAEAARNRRLMPELSALVDEVRSQFPKARLIYGRDESTGYEVGTQGADQVSALDMQPRRIK